MGSTAFSAQLMCRLRTTVTGDCRSAARCLGDVRIGDERSRCTNCITSLLMRAAKHLKAGEARNWFVGPTAVPVPCSSASGDPHAYACKPGSRYVTPRKVKITTPNPRMAK